ncbi:protein NO VEIN domain-containing protein [Sinomonas susongensis]|uniref:protein NO VEIN domain-containing protein n=1 Tax=Sinomonas susongensis TaxID=1324851 RepID=UPI0011096C41|nr:DUF3883 domain-containing protein [Sinomonas susongensis]
MTAVTRQDNSSESGSDRVPWSEAQISVTVDAYFCMLEEELASRSYVKARYNREVQALTGRSHGAVEYKFQNISHVLHDAGFRYIDGYKPATNAQAALKYAVLSRVYGLAQCPANEKLESYPPIEDLLRDRRQRYAGICLDPVLRKAIEHAAVQQAVDFYERKGYQVEDVGLSRSYDLHLVRHDEERHVEVKGSQGRIEKIVLTRNEVRHAQAFENTDLVLVHAVPWERAGDGTVSCGKGSIEVKRNWQLVEEDLMPLSYEYTVAR